MFFFFCVEALVGAVGPSLLQNLLSSLGLTGSSIAFISVLSLGLGLCLEVSVDVNSVEHLTEMLVMLQKPC